MKQSTRNVLASVAGVAVFGVLSYGVYRLLSGSSSTTATTRPPAPAPSDTTPAPSPSAAACAKAAELAQAAKSSPDPNAERKPYEYWAAICRQGGGTPPAFPS